MLMSLACPWVGSQADQGGCQVNLQNIVGESALVGEPYEEKSPGSNGIQQKIPPYLHHIRGKAGFEDKQFAITIESKSMTKNYHWLKQTSALCNIYHKLCKRNDIVFVWSRRSKDQNPWKSVTRNILCCNSNTQPDLGFHFPRQKYGVHKIHRI